MSHSNGFYLSRRDFLLLSGLGCASMTVSFVCGGLAAALVLLGKDDAVTPTAAGTGATEPAPSQATPEPTANAYYPAMITRAEWGAEAPNHAAVNETGFYSLRNPEGWRWYQEDLAEIYRTVVIHHSGMYESGDLSTLLGIQETHRDGRGWADIGYHYVIGKTGTVYEGRDIHVRGSHVEGYNTGSVGVCLMGNFMISTPADAQIGATIGLVRWLTRAFALTHLAGHSDFTFTECPGDNLFVYLDGMAVNAGLERGVGGYVMPPEQIRATETAQASACLCGAVHN